jgi:hypothetical protein
MLESATDTKAPRAAAHCPCEGYGVRIHPAWAEFYQAVGRNEFKSQADYSAFWRARGCPTDLAGHLLLPPEEIACECGQAVAA